jgi:hypothetical protein
MQLYPTRHLSPDLEAGYWYSTEGNLAPSFRISTADGQAERPRDE